MQGRHEVEGSPPPGHPQRMEPIPSPMHDRRGGIPRQERRWAAYPTKECDCVEVCCRACGDPQAGHPVRWGSHGQAESRTSVDPEPPPRHAATWRNRHSRCESEGFAACVLPRRRSHEDCAWSHRRPEAWQKRHYPQRWRGILMRPKRRWASWQKRHQCQQSFVPIGMTTRPRTPARRKRRYHKIRACVAANCLPSPPSHPRAWKPMLSSAASASGIRCATKLVRTL